MVDVPGDILGGEFAAVVPLDSLAHMQGPGLEVVAGFPAFQQIGARNIVRAGLGHISADLAADVAVEYPAVGVRVLDVQHAHLDADGAALGKVGPGGPNEAFAGYLADEGIGRAGRNPEQGRGAQEFAAVDFAFGKLFFQDGNIRVLPTFIHDPWSSKRGAAH